MKFGPVPVSDALGAILAHSVPLAKGRLRKGKMLEDTDIAKLVAAGLESVVVARLDPTDVHEDSAAARLAAAIVPDPESAGLSLGNAATGRVNIHAAFKGVAEISPEKINAINAIHPMITVATVPEWQRMDVRGMVATVKIISYGVPEDALAKACADAEGAIELRAPVMANACLIQTIVGNDDGEKGQRALQQRLDRLNVSLKPKTLVRHDEAELCAALKQSEADILFILTGSATSDIDDVAPRAVRAAGGSVHHYGMPVDPGNLLFLGDLNGRPVIGLPGCARSPAMNGADWVMDRIICDVAVTGAHIARMGVGGLLKEIPTRPRPRDTQS